MPLCGNSIGTDRRFLAAYLPDDRGPPALPLDRRVERQGARQALVPEASTRRVRSKVGQHRALDDIRDSIDELRYYREHVFVARDVEPPSTATAERRGDAPDARPCVPSSRRTAGPRSSRVDDVADAGPGPDEILVDVHHTRAQPGRRPAAAGAVPRSASPRRRSEIPGLEYAGVVAAVGDRVTELVGRRRP